MQREWYESEGRRSGPARSGPGRGGARPHGRGIPLSDLDPELTQASHKVIGCARDVHVALGPGYDADVYLEAMKHELTAGGIRFKSREPIEIRHRDARVGEIRPDLLVEDRFIVEVLAQPREIGGYERARLRAQLRAADVELGLIINFAGRLLKDGLVRVLNLEKLGITPRGDRAETRSPHEEIADDESA